MVINDDVPINILTLLTILGLIGSFCVALVKLSVRMAKLELKVETMWGFQMRRAMSEVVEKQLGTMSSPLEFNPNVLDRLDPIKEELRADFNQQWRKLSDGEILLAIERKYGTKLLKMICVPCNLSHGACLLLALTVAKDRNSINPELFSRYEIDATGNPS